MQFVNLKLYSTTQQCHFEFDYFSSPIAMRAANFVPALQCKQVRPFAVHPPYGCSLSQADLDQLRQAVLPVQDVRVLKRIHQLVCRFALSCALLDQ